MSTPSTPATTPRKKKKPPKAKIAKGSLSTSTVQQALSNLAAAQSFVYASPAKSSLSTPRGGGEGFYASDRTPNSAMRDPPPPRPADAWPPRGKAPASHPASPLPPAPPLRARDPRDPRGMSTLCSPGEKGGVFPTPRPFTPAFVLPPSLTDSVNTAPAPSMPGLDAEMTSPPKRNDAVTSYAAAANLPPTGPIAASSAPAPQPKREKYPPLVVETLPNWATHFRALKNTLGRAPNARPFGKGIRFLPQDGEEYRVVQSYLANLEKEANIKWYSYTLPKDRSLKIAIRGLPADTEPAAIADELRTLGYEPEYVRAIRARQGRPGAIFYALLKRTPDLMPGIYNIGEMLCMPGIKIEAWRGRKGPAQCHRCQLFRHSSHCCHRTLACVRCGEAHTAKDCPRPLTEPATCANCGGAHPANNINCPVFKKELRNKRGTAAVTSKSTPAEPKRAEAGPKGEASAPQSLMAAANAPQVKGQSGRKPRRNKKRKRSKTASEVAEEVEDHARPQELPQEQREAPHKRRAPQHEPTRAANQQPKRPAQEEDQRGDILMAAVKVLQEVLTAVQTDQDPVPVILRGLATLFQYNG